MSDVPATGGTSGWNVRTVAIVVAIVLGVTLVPWSCEQVRRDGIRRLEEKARRAAWQEMGQRVLTEIWGFKGEPGLVIKDLKTGWTYHYKKDMELPSASIVKVPLMAAVLAAADEGRFGLDRQIVLRSSDKLDGAGFLKDIPPGASYTVSRLIGLMITESDNTATNMLTTLMGIGRLNEIFAGFGLERTRLARRVADYAARDRGLENVTTAAEMAGVFERIYRGQLVNKHVSDQCIATLKLARTNDRIPKYLPAHLTVAHKTGLERAVCHDAGIIYTRRGDLLVVALVGHDHPDHEAAKEFIARVSLAAYEYLAASE